MVVCRGHATFIVRSRTTYWGRATTQNSPKLWNCGQLWLCHSGAEATHLAPNSRGGRGCRGLVFSSVAWSKSWNFPLSVETGGSAEVGNQCLPVVQSWLLVCKQSNHTSIHIFNSLSLYMQVFSIQYMYVGKSLKISFSFSLSLYESLWSLIFHHCGANPLRRPGQNNVPTIYSRPFEHLSELSAHPTSDGWTRFDRQVAQGILWHIMALGCKIHKLQILMWHWCRALRFVTEHQHQWRSIGQQARLQHGKYGTANL